MTLVSIKAGSEDGIDTAKLELSDTSFLSVKACYINDCCEDLSDWEPGRNISVREEEVLRFASSCYRVERVGMRLIARAEQRSLAFKAKLEQRGFDSAAVKTVISRFLELGLLNDGRYAETWLRSRLSRQGGKPTGPRKLAAMLQNRGIDRAAASAALESVMDLETEWSLLQRFLARNSVSGAFFSLRSRLRAEGFSPDILNRYFEE